MSAPVCDVCNVHAAAVRCGHCVLRRYCSDQCADADWPQHVANVAANANAAVAIEDDTAGRRRAAKQHRRPKDTAAARQRRRLRRQRAALQQAEDKRAAAREIVAENVLDAARGERDAYSDSYRTSLDAVERVRRELADATALDADAERARTALLRHLDRVVGIVRGFRAHDRAAGFKGAAAAKIDGNNDGVDDTDATVRMMQATVQLLGELQNDGDGGDAQFADDIAVAMRTVGARMLAEGAAEGGVVERERARNIAAELQAVGVDAAAAAARFGAEEGGAHVGGWLGSVLEPLAHAAERAYTGYTAPVPPPEQCHVTEFAQTLAHRAGNAVWAVGGGAVTKFRTAIVSSVLTWEASDYCKREKLVVGSMRYAGSELFSENAANVLAGYRAESYELAVGCSWIITALATVTVLAHKSHLLGVSSTMLWAIGGTTARVQGAADQWLKATSIGFYDALLGNAADDGDARTRAQRVSALFQHWLAAGAWGASVVVHEVVMRVARLLRTLQDSLSSSWVIAVAVACIAARHGVYYVHLTTATMNAIPS